MNIYRNMKYIISWGSMVARLKLKSIDGGAHKKWSLRLNFTQQGESCQNWIVEGLSE